MLKNPACRNEALKAFFRKLRHVLITKGHLLISKYMIHTYNCQQVRHSSLCRAVQDGFLLSDLPDLRLLLVKLIAKTQANTCLSCPISCSTTPGVTRTSSAYVVRVRRPRTSSAHVICARHPRTSPRVVCASSPHHLCVICACACVVRTRTHHPHIIYTSSALLPMVSMGLNYLLL